MTISEIPTPVQMPALDGWGEGKRAKSDMVRRAALRKLATCDAASEEVAGLVQVVLAETNLDFFAGHEGMSWLVGRFGLKAFYTCDIRVVRAALRPREVYRLLKESMPAEEAEIACTLLDGGWRGKFGDMMEASERLAYRAS